MIKVNYEINNVNDIIGTTFIFDLSYAYRRINEIRRTWYANEKI